MQTNLGQDPHPVLAQASSKPDLSYIDGDTISMSSTMQKCLKRGNSQHLWGTCFIPYIGGPTLQILLMQL